MLRFPDGETLDRFLPLGNEGLAKIVRPTKAYFDEESANREAVRLNALDPGPPCYFVDLVRLQKPVDMDSALDKLHSLGFFTVE